MDELELHKMDEDGYDRISFDDENIEYPHAQGYENFVEQLSAYFPEERDNLENYCEEIQYVQPVSEVSCRRKGELQRRNPAFEYQEVY